MANKVANSSTLSSLKVDDTLVNNLLEFPARAFQLKVDKATGKKEIIVNQRFLDRRAARHGPDGELNVDDDDDDDDLLLNEVSGWRAAAISRAEMAKRQKQEQIEHEKREKLKYQAELQKSMELMQNTISLADRQALMEKRKEGLSFYSSLLYFFPTLFPSNCVVVVVDRGSSTQTTTRRDRAVDVHSAQGEKVKTTQEEQVHQRERRRRQRQVQEQKEATQGQQQQDERAEGGQLSLRRHQGREARLFGRRR